MADLNPSRGSEQAGVRPVIIVQRDKLAQFTTTSVVVPLTTNLRRSIIPGTIVIPSGEGGLTQESVVLCYQIVVIDKQRLSKLARKKPSMLRNVNRLKTLTNDQ